MPDVCPNCDAALQKVPTRKTKCKACGQFIYVKCPPESRTKQLMTEAQADAVDAYWRAKYERSRLDDDMQSLGLPAGRDAASSRAAMTQLALDASGDLQRRTMAAITLSTPRHSPGMEARVRWAALAATLELEGLRRHGGIAEIRAGQAPCPSCQALRGSVWTIEDALRRMPLPNTRCDLFLRGGGCCAYWVAQPDANQTG